jgi:hypothetical protein
MNKPNKDHDSNVNPQTSTDQEDLYKELESATGGSIFSVVYDVATSLSPLKHLLKATTGVYAEEEKVMERTGQTSFSDEVKWKLLPTTMMEKTIKGESQALESVTERYAKNNEQYNDNLDNLRRLSE